MTMEPFKRALLITGGTVCVVLGFLGIFVPLLPTTPFLLLVAVCYARSSQRLHQRLMSSRWLGEYIRNYREGKGMMLSQKVLTISLLWVTIGYVVGFVPTPWWAKGILLVVAGGVTWHLVRIRTIRSKADPVNLGHEHHLTDESV